MDDNTHAVFSKRNYYLGIVNGALFFLMLRLIDSQMVLALFIDRLTGSAALLGLITSLMNVGWLWPQIFLARILDPVPRKKPYYVLSAVTRMIVFGAAFLSIYFLAEDHAMTLFVVLTILLFAFSSCGAIGIIPFMDIVSKSVPAWKRGSFFGYRRIWGGVLGFGGGLLVRYVLREDSGWAFPNNYLLLFGLAFILLVVSTGLFCLSEEFEQPVQRRRISFRMQMHRGWQILRYDTNFQRLLICRALLSFGWMAFPFYALYAVKKLGVAKEMVGTFMIASVVAGTFSNFVWQRLSDKRGNRLVLRWTSGAALSAPLVALLVGHLPSSYANVEFMGLPAKVAFYFLTFIGLGLGMDGLMIGGVNYLLDIAPEKRRPTYIGFMYTFSAPLMLVPAAAGHLVEVISFEFVFALSFLFSMAAVGWTWFMREPREDVRLRHGKDRPVCAAAAPVTTK